MPDKAVVHLPSSLTMKSVFDRMREELDGQREMVSQPQFYILWKEYYPHVTISAVSPTITIKHQLVKGEKTNL